MAFSTIFIIVIICYAIFYSGMIVYDLFFKKDQTDLLPKQEDEEVDISDEVGQFKPILIEKDKPMGRKEKPKVTEAKGSKEHRESTQGSSSKKDEPPAVPMTETFDDEPSNRKSLSDVGPKEPDAKEREHIRELVRQTREELENERRQDDFQKDEKQAPSHPAHSSQTPKKTGKETTESKSTIQKEHKIPRYVQIRNDSTPADTGKKKSATIEIKDSENKSHKIKVTKPEKPRAPLAKFDFYVDIDEEAQKTKLCGGRTAEEVQEEFKGMPLDQVKVAIEKMGNYLQLLKQERQLTEEEIEAIENSKNTTRAPLAKFDF